VTYKEPKYKPVACDFVDWRYDKDVLIKTWENRGEEGEFLILAENKGDIRLDYIGSINGKSPIDVCGI